MKKIFTLLMMAVGMSAAADNNDYTYLEVVTSAGQITDVTLNTVQKITFVRGQMVVTTTGGETQEFALNNLERLYFSGTPDAIETSNISASNSEVVAIYTLDGRRLSTRNPEVLNGGVYIIRRADGTATKVRL